MKTEVVDKILKAYGVPPLVYEWDLDPLSPELAKQLADKIPDVVAFVKNRKNLTVFIEDDMLQASRIAIATLRQMLQEDYRKVGYLTPAKIANLKAEAWEGSKEYETFLNLDLVVIDKVYLEPLDVFKVTALWEFVEARLLSRKSLVMAASGKFVKLIPKTIASAFLESDNTMIRG